MKIKKEKILDIAFVAAILAVALLARIPLLPLESGDYYFCLSVWMDRIREIGPWESLGMKVSNYSSAYMYIMCLLSGISNTLYALKGFSILFDYIGAVVVFFLVRKLTGSTRKGIAGLAVTLLCPSVIINSAWWCQCDIIYVTFMLACILCILHDKGALCCIMLGIAFAFKVQAVFLLPFLLILWVKGHCIKLWHFLLIPAVFLVIQIPALIAGRPLQELLGVYIEQAGEYPYGTLKYPNIYEFMDETHMDWHHVTEVGGFGLYFSIGVLGLFAWLVCTMDFKITPQLLITLALFSVCLVLFTMPHMHERYGFLVDILAIVYAIQRPEKIPIAISYVVISVITYMAYLNGCYLLPFVYLSMAMLALNILVCRDLFRQISENKKTENLFAN